MTLPSSKEAGKPFAATGAETTAAEAGAMVPGTRVLARSAVTAAAVIRLLRRCPADRSRGAVAPVTVEVEVHPIIALMTVSLTHS